MELKNILKNNAVLSDFHVLIRKAFLRSVLSLGLRKFSDTLGFEEGCYFTEVKYNTHTDSGYLYYDRSIFDRFLCVHQTSDYQDIRVYLCSDKEDEDDIYLFSFKTTSRLIDDELVDATEVTYSPKIAYKLLVEGFSISMTWDRVIQDGKTYYAK